MNAARRAATLCALLVAALAACTLLGWSLDSEVLTGYVLGGTAMKANTAAACLLLAAALALHARSERRPVVIGASLIVLALVIATLAEWVSGADLGIDELVARDGTAAAGAPPGRMAPSTALCLALIATGLLADRVTWRGRRLATGLVTAVTALTLLAVISLVAGMSSVDGFTGATRMASSTAAAMLLLAGGLLASRPHARAMRLLTSPGLGGVLARRLLPIGVGAPLALDAVRIILVDAGVLGQRSSIWLFVFLIVAVAASMIVRSAHRLDDADALRRASEDQLRLSEALARSVTDSAHDAIICSNGDGDMISFNAGAERMFGWRADEAVGRPTAMLMPERAREEHLRGMQRVAASGNAGQYGSTVEVVGLTADEREFDLELSVTAFAMAGETYVTAILRDVTERNHLDAQLRGQASRLEQVVAAQGAIGGGSGELDEIMGMVAARAATIVGADGAAVELPDGDDLVYRAAVGSAAGHLGMRISLEGSLSGAALRSDQTLHCVDADLDPRVDVDAARRTGLGSMVCVPLRHEDAVVGVLEVISSRAHAFTESDERTLELLAGLAGGAVRRAQSERRLAAHHTVSRALAEADSLEAGLSAALRGLGQHLGWDMTLAWLVPEDEDAARLVASWHDSRVAARPFVDASRAAAPKAGEGAVGRAWGACRPDWADDMEAVAERRGDLRARAAIASGLMTAAIVPIIARGEALGALELASRERRPRDADTLALLEMLAAQVGQFVQRKRAEDRVAVHATHLKAVVELSDEVSRLSDPNAVRPAVCHAVRAITDSDMTAVLEPDAGGRLAITAQAGDLVEEGHAPDQDTVVVGRAFRQGRSGVLTDALDSDGADRAFLQRTGLRSVHLEPLMRDGRAVGVLAIGSRSVRREMRAELAALVHLLAAETVNALERTDLVAALDASARTDQLTGVPNRRAWDEVLDRELARARRAQEPISVAILDLDHFKAYNDTHGHPAGDRLLRDAAAAWTERMRTTDTLARYGGEEFALVLPGCNAQAAAGVLGELRGALPDEVTCSIGVATWDGAEEPDALVGRADAALYRAKRDGRDRVAVAGPPPAPPAPPPAPPGV